METSQERCKDVQWGGLLNIGKNGRGKGEGNGQKGGIICNLQLCVLGTDVRKLHNF